MALTRHLVVAGLFSATSVAAASSILSIAAFGAVPNDEASNCTNRDAFNRALSAAEDGDTVLVPGGATWHLVGGVVGYELEGVTVQVDGALNFLPDLDHCKATPNRNQPTNQPRPSSSSHSIRFDSIQFNSIQFVSLSVASLTPHAPCMFEQGTWAARATRTTI